MTSTTVSAAPPTGKQPSVTGNRLLYIIANLVAAVVVINGLRICLLHFFKVDVVSVSISAVKWTWDLCGICLLFFMPLYCLLPWYVWRRISFGPFTPEQNVRLEKYIPIALVGGMFFVSLKLVGLAHLAQAPKNADILAAFVAPLLAQFFVFIVNILQLGGSYDDGAS